MPRAATLRQKLQISQQEKKPPDVGSPGATTDPVTSGARQEYQF